MSFAGGTGPNQIEMLSVSLPVPAVVESLSAYVPSGNCQMALYSDNGGAPGTLIAQTGVVGASGWTTAAIANTTLPAGNYWVGAQTDSSYIYYSYVSGSYYALGQSWGPFPVSISGGMEGSGGIPIGGANYCSLGSASTYTPTATVTATPTTTFIATASTTATVTKTGTLSPTPSVTWTSTSTPVVIVLISQLETRSTGGASDEFVELYNAGTGAVILDSTWTLTGRASSASSYTNAWTGSGTTLPSHGHYLIAGTAYARTPAADATLLHGITDAGALSLNWNGTTVDAIGFYYDTMTQSTLTGGGYVMEGSPVFNPHDNTTGTNVDSSLERKPGGSGGNATNTGNNAADFAVATPADPHNTTSAPVP
jgi:hypothetical protein